MKKKILKKATAALLAAVVFTSACASQSTGNAEKNETSVSERKKELTDMELSWLLRKPGKRNGVSFF